MGRFSIGRLKWLRTRWVRVGGRFVVGFGKYAKLIAICVTESGKVQLLLLLFRRYGGYREAGIWS